MRAELICVGTELLLGQIVNTNAKWIGQKLSEVGIDLFYCTTVGDNEERIQSAIKIAELRADILIFSGGLGPTADDLTKEAIAHRLDLQLVVYPPAKERIISFFETRKISMPDNNLKQAQIFENGMPLENKNGLAVGCVVQHEQKYYMVLPGPPAELQRMFAEEGLPYLAKRIGKENQIYVRVLRFFGLGESVIEESVSEIIAKQKNVYIAPLLDQGEVTLRLTTKAASEAEANQKFAPLVEAILLRIGKYYMGEGTENLPTRLIDVLTDRGITIGSAESFTGGAFLSALTEISGASEVVRGGFITYTNEIKQKLLQVEEEILNQKGAVSSACAEQMALGVKKQLGVDIAVSFTGVAGPSISEGKAVGTVFIGFQLPHTSFVKQMQLTGDRKMIRERAIYYACARILRELKIESSV